MWSQPDVIAALVALGGVLISAAIAWFVARHTANTELRKQRLQFFQAYAERLQEHRLTAYPAAFEILSACAKELHRGTLTREDLVGVLARLETWDSAHSLLLSGRASNVLWDGQRAIEGLANESAQTPIPAPSQSMLMKHVEQMELVLKEDVGVFSVEYEDARKFASYREIEDISDSPRGLRSKPIDRPV